MPKVLVTAASERAALAVIRSLGKKHIDVTAGDSTRFATGFLSKYCKQKILYPSPEREKTQFVKTMLKLVEKESFDLLLPITDLTMVPLIEQKKDFERYTKVAAPDYSVAVKALDKIATLQVARQHNIPFPRTMLGCDINDISEFSKEIRYPVVIRPRMKVSWIGDKAMILKVTQKNYAHNSQDLVEKWMKLVSILKKVGLDEDFLMIQEFVKGVGFGVETIMQEGKPKALFMHRRLREYPTTGGASTLRESAQDSNLALLSVKLLRAIGWEGVAMVEFRVDVNTGRAELIEINGRFWGSLPLALSCGVDFPYLLYKSAVDKESSPVPGYRTGLRQRWLAGDFLWLYSSLVNRNGIAKSVVEFLRSSAVPDDIMTLDDSAPVCGELLFILEFLANVLTRHRSLTGEILQ